MKRLIFILALLVVIGSLFVVGRIRNFYNAIYTPSNSKDFPTKPPEEKSVYTVLLMGYGGGSHEGTYLTDSLMIARVDIKNKKATLISLPRDIWVKIPTKSGEDFHEKINAVYQIALFYKNYSDIDEKYGSEQGAAELLKASVKEVVGFPIDYYVAIDFAGFVKAVDMIGGVDVEVEKTFDDYEYPVEGKEKDLCGKEEKDLPELEKIATESPELAFPCRYEHLHFDQGKQHMDGVTALKYVRSRHSAQDGNDFGRAKRQQRFVQATKDKVVSIGFIPKIIPLLGEMKDYIRLDIPFEIMQKFVGEGSNSDKYKITNIVPTTEDFLQPSRSSYGGFILVPNKGEDQWDAFHKHVQNVIKGIMPSPTKSPTTEVPQE